MQILLIAAAFTLSAALSGAVIAAEEPSGEQAFNNNCRTCHTWKEGDNRLGPNLHGLIGRKAGSVEGFAYSPSMKGAKITWDAGTLDKFMADPDSVVPNNNMKPFTGISDAKTRAQIIEFLNSNPE